KPSGVFKRGGPVAIRVSPKGKMDGVELRYRHVNQAELWTSTPMKAASGSWAATIPADYADSPYSLQYYFVIRSGKGAPALHPGLGKSLMEQPYYVLRQA